MRPVFSSIRSLLWLFVGLMVLGFLVYGFGSGGPANDAPKNFLAACEASPAITAHAAGTTEAAKLCSCILGWHLRAAPGGEAFLPVQLYILEGPDAGAGLSDRTLDLDRRARSSCVTGRVAG